MSITLEKVKRENIFEWVMLASEVINPQTTIDITDNNNSFGKKIFQTSSKLKNQTLC